MIFLHFNRFRFIVQLSTQLIKNEIEYWNKITQDWNKYNKN